MEKLLSPKGNTEAKILILCEVITSIGKNLERANKSSVQRLDTLFKNLEILSKTNITTRVKFAILDLFDLRNDGWPQKKNRDEQFMELSIEVEKSKLTKETEIDKIYCKFTLRDLERKTGFNGTTI